jgi:hypothetical protein
MWRLVQVLTCWSMTATRMLAVSGVEPAQYSTIVPARNSKGSQRHQIASMNSIAHRE